MKAEHNSQNLFFRSPFGAQPCNTQVTLRLGLSMTDWPDSVKLHYNINDGECRQIGMHFFEKHMDITYFEAKLTLPDAPCLVLYWFEIHSADGVYYYGNNELCRGGIGMLTKDRLLPYQITVYDADYQTPDWFKGKVMYQIFPDRFCGGKGTDSLHVRTDILPRSWGDTPYYKAEQFGGKYLANDFFGGNLKGIEEKLDYLASLGISVLYLNPIFEAYSNHKYDTGDYEKIDAMLGTEEDFKNLCSAAKAKGIRIVLDGVFNHTGSDSKYFNIDGKYPTVGAYQSQSSPYADWYSFGRYPDIYDCWWGIKTLPHINELSPTFMEYILTGENAIIKKWLRLGASGWRLDVVDELPDEFIKQLRTSVKATDKDAVIIGEVWEDASNKMSYGKRKEYLGGYELDSAMNYPMREALIDFVREKYGGSFLNASLNSLKENYPPQAFHAMMNFLSSHDTARILTTLAPDANLTDEDRQADFKLSGEALALAKKRLHLITAMQMTLPGTPCVYYGDEVGMQGFGDPFCRGCFPWGNEDTQTLAFFKELIQLRNSYNALQNGELITVYGEGPACAYLRIGKTETLLVVANSATKHDWHATLELGKFDIHRLKDITNDETLESCTGRFNVYLEPCSYKILEVIK